VDALNGVRPEIPCKIAPSEISLGDVEHAPPIDENIVTSPDL
jgi:hypothetical protein